MTRLQWCAAAANSSRRSLEPHLGARVEIAHHEYFPALLSQCAEHFAVPDFVGDRPLRPLQLPVDRQRVAGDALVAAAPGPAALGGRIAEPAELPARGVRAARLG